MDVLKTTAPVIRLGDVVPDFQQNSTVGIINFHEWIGDQWCILFSHPKAFTPICTTELGSMACMSAEFEKRGVKVLAVSCDSVEENTAWIVDIEEVGGSPVTYPILADTDFTVCYAYNMLAEDATAPSGMPVTVRSVFIIGPNKQLKLTLTYPPEVGRNFREILRVVDSLQLSAKKAVGTPANWENGDKAVILPSVNDDVAADQFPGFETKKPYLRYTATGMSNF